MLHVVLLCVGDAAAGAAMLFLAVSTRRSFAESVVFLPSSLLCDANSRRSLALAVKLLWWTPVAGRTQDRLFVILHASGSVDL